MADKPATAAGYSSEQLVLVRSTCLFVATKLGDLMDDLVVVGGLAPSLLVDQEQLPDGADPHVGTTDLDVGLTVALLQEERYQGLAERLRQAGFTQDVNQDGHPTRQRWKIERTGKVTVDFLIQPTRPEDRGGKLRDLEADFAAVIAPGLHLAFQDRRRVTLSGTTLMGERATRDLWVCGPGAFVVLKALAFNDRGENKDAYDLFYVVRNYGAGVEDVAACIKPLLGDPDIRKALDILTRDFTDRDAVGPRRVAEFQAGQADAGIQADVVGFVAQLLRLCGG